MTLDYRTRIYESYASRFDDASPSFDPVTVKRWYDYHFRKWLPADKDAAIVDLACGGGKLLHYLKESGYRDVSGVDISPEQVKLSRQVTPNVVEGNVLDYLETRPLAFDCITGLDIVEHFHKSEVLRFLDLCHAALRPGGRLILTTPNAESPWGGTVRYGDFTHEVCFDSKALLRLLSLCGFGKLEAREQGPAPWNYSMISTVRYGLWQCARMALIAWNIVETGIPGSGILTRVFSVKGEK